MHGGAEWNFFKPTLHFADILMNLWKHYTLSVIKLRGIRSLTIHCMTYDIEHLSIQQWVSPTLSKLFQKVGGGGGGVAPQPPHYRHASFGTIGRWNFICSLYTESPINPHRGHFKWTMQIKMDHMIVLNICTTPIATYTIMSPHSDWVK